MVKIPLKTRTRFRRAKTLQAKRRLGVDPSAAVVAELSVELLREIRAIHKLVSDLLIPALIELDSERVDALPDTIQKQIDLIEFNLNQRVKLKSIQRKFEKQGVKLATGNVRKWRSIIGVPLDPQIQPFIDGFVDTSTMLIKSQTGKTVFGIRRLMEQSIGRRHEDIAKDMQALFNVEESKARFIARDQTAKLNAKITQATHQSVGIYDYEWSTSRDSRVRDMHGELEGTRHAYANPPIVSDDGRTANPGEDYNCRCVAIPVLPDE